jgi:perosamine synthetase
MIPIYKPYLENYKNSAIEAINSEWISNHGIYVDLAANKLKETLNVKYCVLLNNGTSATHCLFKALKFKHPEIKKLYIPNNVFVSPWNCALLEYSSDMLEVMNINENTMNINTEEEYIMNLEKNSGMLIVHNLGNIVNVPRLKRLRPDIIFIEDNCEGIFGKYEDIYSGTSEASIASAVSFYGNKTITTGEGGAFFTNDLEVYKYIKTYYSHGMSNERYIHNILGTNYRMTNVQAALLYDQLNDIKHILELKSNIFTYYNRLFNKLIISNKNNKIRFLITENNTEKSNWMYTIIINDINYIDFEKYMTEKNIQIRPIFYDIHRHEHLKNIKKMSTQEFTNNITQNGVMLPSYPELTNTEQDYIVLCIEEYIKLKF